MSDTFSTVTWNVYAGSGPAALEPHLQREKDKRGVSIFLMQEAGGKGLTPMCERNGLKTFNDGQYRVAWDPQVWPHVIRTRGVRLSPTSYYSVNHKKDVWVGSAEVILCNEDGRTLTVLSYHTPPHVQQREEEQARVAARVQAAFEAHARIGELAAKSVTCGFLAGGDDNWDEDTGIQIPAKKVKEILLGETTGLIQLQAGKPTYGKREIDDYRIPRNGLLKPVGDPWVVEGGGEEQPNHKMHGRTWGWKD